MSIVLLPGETELLRFSAVHRKCLGQALVSTQRLLWEATDAQAKLQRVEIAWAAVKDHMVSAGAGQRRQMCP